MTRISRPKTQTKISSTEGKMKVKMMGIAIGLLALLFMPMYAPAVTWNVTGGILMGANDVNVNGQFYNVEFIDGSCISIFGGCHSTSDFPFQTEEAAQAAAQALLDQVLIDVSWGLFDSHPELTNGITDTRWGDVAIPYKYDPSTHILSLKLASNSPDVVEWGDYDSVITVSGEYAAFDLTDSTGTTYANWHSVPEAPTFVLLACGLAGLVFARRRGKCQKERTL